MLWEEPAETAIACLTLALSCSPWLRIQYSVNLFFLQNVIQSEAKNRSVTMRFFVVLPRKNSSE